MENKNILISTNSSGIQFKQGTDPHLLVIAFTGDAKVLMMNPDDFMSVTGLVKHDRFLLQDPFSLWYQNGVNDQLFSFQKLCGYFRDWIRELQVEKVLIVGTSSGGHAALLAAHHLNADYAHVFGPQTNIGTSSLFEASVKPFRKRLLKVKYLYRQQWRNWKNFDLQKAMRTYNSKTKYFIHFAADNHYDSARALRMKKVPGVKLFGYPYKNHAIIGPLLSDGYMEKLLQDENLGNPQQLFDIFYGEGVQEASGRVAKEPSLEIIAQIIQKVSVAKPEFEIIYGSKDLTSELALDSIACLELVVELENTFGINIEMDVMGAEDLKTVNNILGLIIRSRIQL